LEIETFGTLKLGTYFAVFKADFRAEAGAGFQAVRVSGFDSWRRSHNGGEMS
jgi:hypothetical protein